MSREPVRAPVPSFAMVALEQSPRLQSRTGTPRSLNSLFFLAAVHLLLFVHAACSINTGQGAVDAQAGDVVPHSKTGNTAHATQPPPRPPRPKKVPLVLIATVDGTVTAVKATTGSKLWSVDLGGPLLSSWENQTIFNGSMIVPNTDGSLYVTTAAGVVQRVPVSVQELVSASPFMADDGSLYVASKVSQFYVVDRSTGKVLRQVASDFEDALQEDVEKDVEKGSNRHNHILLGRYEFQIKCMHPETHEISWKAALSYFPNVAALDGGGEEDAVPHDPGAYFYHNGSFYGVDKSAGTVTWWLNLPGPAMTVYYLGNGASGHERFLLPTNAPLSTSDDMNLWGSNIWMGDDIQVNNTLYTERTHS